MSRYIIILNLDFRVPNDRVQALKLQSHCHFFVPSDCKKQVHISEARVGTALDKLAYMEELVNDRLLLDRNTLDLNQTSTSPSTSAASLDTVKSMLPRKSKSLNVSGPVQPYHPHLKNFWYPVAFSTDLKEDTMVSQFSKHLSLSSLVIIIREIYL